MTAVAADARRVLDIGKVFTDAFGIVKRRGLVFGALLLVGSIPSLIDQFIQIQTTRAAIAAIQAGATPHPPAVSLGGSLIGFVLTIASIVLLPTVYAAITYASVKDLDGARLDIQDSLKIGLRSWFGLVGLVLLMIIPLAIGFILLVVPGVMLSMAWSVAIQAKIAERIGPIKALGRSLRLTRGNRWRIFLFSLIILVVVWLLEGAALVAAMLPMVLSGGPAGSAKFMAIFTNPVSVAVFTLFSVIAYLISTSLGAALYQQLRTLRDGPGAQTTAEVFA